MAIITGNEASYVVGNKGEDRSRSHVVPLKLKATPQHNVKVDYSSIHMAMAVAVAVAVAVARGTRGTRGDVDRSALRLPKQESP